MGMFAGLRQYVAPFGIGGIFDVISEMGEEVYNDTGGTLAKGTLVYKSGWHAGTSRPKVTKADADVAGAGATLVILEALPTGKRGVAHTKGYLGGQVTTGRTVGDAVYASNTAGTYVFVSEGSGQRVGRVAVVHATNGYIQFDIEPATNANAGAAMFLDNPDVVIPFSHHTNTVISGTWTRTRTSAGLYRLRRTAALAAHAVAFEVPVVRLRSTAFKGLKVTGVKLKYRITVEVMNDVTLSAAYTVMPVDGAAVAAETAMAGGYDAGHDTAGERGAIAEHTMTFTFAAPVFLADGFLELLVSVDDTTGGTAVFDILQIELLASENLIDAV